MTEQIYIVRAKVSYEVIDVSGPHETRVGLAGTEEQAIDIVRELIDEATLAQAKGAKKRDR